MKYVIVKDKKIKKINKDERLEFNGYFFHPQKNKKNLLRVKKIIIISPNMTEAIIKKKLVIQINSLLAILKTLEEDDTGSSDIIQESLIKCERLKIMIVNKYLKYLGKEFSNLTLKKLQIIANQLQNKLYNNFEKEYIFASIEEFDKNTKRGR
ncbi:MAG: hypothetical protein Q4G04_06050 [bacterium]|nr:hypothetical protein [bacterium]